ncbi:aldo/keto reductase, partial [Acinetobacter baumannii]
HYRRLGSSGLHVSALSFGAWVTFGNQIGRSTARELIAAAWDHGITFFDNAEGYANGEAERVMGDVIADLRLPRDGF